jgi:hypothetical protein
LYVTFTITDARLPSVSTAFHARCTC